MTSKELNQNSRHLLFVMTLALVPEVHAASRYTDRPPVVSGIPATIATVGTSYSFTPQASDPEGRPLTFSVAGLPAWASFNTSTGTLSGTPTSSNIGTSGAIAIGVADRRSKIYLPGFTITVQVASTRTNASPVISGSPVPTINVGGAYVFAPAATDADGEALSFSIVNKPAWATFNATTGQLSGTPAAGNVGMFSGITISVSDGKATAALAAFTISVTQIATGSATLSWTPPIQNTDGTPLGNLTGYRIYFGTNSSSLTQSVNINNASVSTYILGNLSPATWYFAVKAIANGVESDFSNVASKTIG